MRALFGVPLLTIALTPRVAGATDVNSSSDPEITRAEAATMAFVAGGFALATAVTFHVLAVSQSGFNEVCDNRRCEGRRSGTALPLLAVGSYALALAGGGVGAALLLTEPASATHGSAPRVDEAFVGASVHF